MNNTQRDILELLLKSLVTEEIHRQAAIFDRAHKGLTKDHLLLSYIRVTMILQEITRVSGDQILEDLKSARHYDEN